MFEAAIEALNDGRLKLTLFVKFAVEIIRLR